MQRPDTYPDSFDSKLFFTFFIGMIVQMPLPINGIARFVLAIFWGGMLVQLSIQHRRYYQWHWRGISRLDLLKSLGVSGLQLCGLIFFIAAAITRFKHDRKWQPDYLFGELPEAIRLLPEFITSTSPLVSFLLLPCAGILFNTLIRLKVVYLAEEEFLNDCQNRQVALSQYRERVPDSSGNRRSQSFIKKITGFFTSRPFVVQKLPDAIRIEFYTISSQDLQANFALVGLLLLFFLFSSYGLVSMFVFGLPGYLNHLERPEYLPIVLSAWSFQVVFFSVIPYLIWRTGLRLLFTKKILDFKAGEFIVGETVFERYRKLFSIRQTELLPLKEKQKNVTVPGMSNTALLIRQRGKDVEVAGHLLPEAMEAIQQVFKHYRTSTFNRFYCETKPLYLK
jgi:hypothetical protein